MLKLGHVFNWKRVCALEVLFFKYKVGLTLESVGEIIQTKNSWAALSSGAVYADSNTVVLRVVFTNVCAWDEGEIRLP